MSFQANSQLQPDPWDVLELHCVPEFISIEVKEPVFILLTSGQPGRYIPQHPPALLAGKEAPVTQGQPSENGHKGHSLAVELC